MPSFLAYRPGLMSHLGSILIQIVPGGPAGISIFFSFFFGPQIGLEWFPRAPGGPGGYFYMIFGLFWGPGGPRGGIFFFWGPIFPIPGPPCGAALRRNLHWSTVFHIMRTL